MKYFSLASFWNHKKLLLTTLLRLLLAGVLSFIFFQEKPYFTFYIALCIMIIGSVLVTTSKMQEENHEN